VDAFDQESDLSDEITIDARERVAMVRGRILKGDFGLFVKENGASIGGDGVDVTPAVPRVSGNAVNDPIWSPNGRYLAYVHTVAGKARVYLAGPDFSQPARDITGASDRNWLVLHRMGARQPLCLLSHSGIERRANRPLSLRLGGRNRRRHCSRRRHQMGPQLSHHARW
jgi:hypothetical protein